MIRERLEQSKHKAAEIYGVSRIRHAVFHINVAPLSRRGRVKWQPGILRLRKSEKATVAVNATVTTIYIMHVCKIEI
jgi:hypothetical protein